ncbi:B12-binding domain-containing radical SAM protein [Flexithrix dorotheae]|uniref:B12-binding domain-containing radical SAM protein n=1 Tax=Flexithrix dorotheae TaxID=70993 RepID=UPI0004768589|nr:radical SAM protein [Flexithrix dorotheae]
MEKKVYLITPPFTQLNTPYPATTYLKGFLNTINISAFQSDLGIDVILRLFSKKGLEKLFREVEQNGDELSENAQRMLSLKKDYLLTIDSVIAFLQDKNPTLAHTICDGEYLPEASRFQQLEELDWAFGTMGIRDKARHLATLYLEDLADFIKETIDPHFGFSRYAERLGMSANSFDEIYEAVLAPETFVDNILVNILNQRIKTQQPEIVCISVPFPGNLYGAFRCGQFIKNNYPHVHVVLGGGYVNTELRSLTDSRVFDFVDFITLDDGERPIQCLIEMLEGKRELKNLKRTFSRHEDAVIYWNGALEGDIPFSKTGTPDYSDLPLKNYLSVIEIVNPMHRLWSDGRWNKLTLAHGCYWKKCTFCDISLDYIGRYTPVNASIICDRMEELIAQTGESGFHFVDEAAPPALMRDVALEILKRGLTVTWWTNIRFEKNFTADLCRLLQAAGCMAVSGGLEVASDRLLDLMKKGVTVAQVAKVAENFTKAGIMVHAYLMYGFPTQTAQETIDSLEMVRQLFEAGVVQSGFWHRFAMTAHSPVGLNPAAFGVVKVGPDEGSFANNDLVHEDPDGADHAQFSEGLRKSLFNYMHGICLDFPLYEWFDFKIPKTTVPKNYIQKAIANSYDFESENSKVIWLGNLPVFSEIEVNKKGKIRRKGKITIHNKAEKIELITMPEIGKWLSEILPELASSNPEKYTLGKLIETFESQGIGDFDKLANSFTWGRLRESGLLML